MHRMIYILLPICIYFPLKFNNDAEIKFTTVFQAFKEKFVVLFNFVIRIYKVVV